MKKNFWSKLVAIILVVTFASSLLSVQAFATDPTPSPNPTATPAPTVTPTPTPTPFGFEITVSVSNAADESFTGDILLNQIMNDGGATTLTVRQTYTSTQILKTEQIDYVTKSALVSGLLPGSYLFTLKRPGYLLREFTVVVSENADLGDMPLIPGDVDESGAIDFADTAYVSDAYSLYIGDSGYLPKYDFNLDGVIDFVDIGMIDGNYGLDVSAYGDFIDYN